MKAIKTKLQETDPERVAVFEKNAATFAKKVVGSFKDFEFVRHDFCSFVWMPIPPLQYTSESMNPEGMVALLNYRVRPFRIDTIPWLTFCTGGRYYP